MFKKIRRVIRGVILPLLLACAMVLPVGSITAFAASQIPVSLYSATLNGQDVTAQPPGHGFADKTPATFAMALSWAQSSVSVGDYFRLKISAEAVMPGFPANNITITSTDGQVKMQVMITGNGGGIASGTNSYTDDPATFPNGYYLITGTVTAAPAGYTNYSGTYNYSAQIHNLGGSTSTFVPVKLLDANGKLIDFTVQPGPPMPDYDPNHGNQKYGGLGTHPTDLKKDVGQPQAMFIDWMVSLNWYDYYDQQNNLAYSPMYNLQHGIITDTLGPGQAFLASDLQQEIDNYATEQIYTANYTDTNHIYAYLKVGPQLYQGFNFQTANEDARLVYGLDGANGTPFPSIPAGNRRGGGTYSNTHYYSIPMRLVTTPIVDLVNAGTAQLGDVYLNPANPQQIQIYVGNIGLNAISLAYSARITDPTLAEYTNKAELADGDFHTVTEDTNVKNSTAGGTITASNAPTIEKKVGKDDTAANQALHPSTDPYQAATNPTGQFTYASTVTLKPTVGGGSSDVTYSTVQVSDTLVNVLKIDDYYVKDANGYLAKMDGSVTTPGGTLSVDASSNTVSYVMSASGGFNFNNYASAPNNTVTLYIVAHIDPNADLTPYTQSGSDPLIPNTSTLYFNGGVANSNTVYVTASSGGILFTNTYGTGSILPFVGGPGAKAFIIGGTILGILLLLFLSGTLIYRNRRRSRSLGK